MKAIGTIFKTLDLPSFLPFDTIRIFLPAQVALWLACSFQTALNSGERLGDKEPVLKILPVEQGVQARAAGKIWRGNVLIDRNPFPLDAFPNKTNLEERSALQDFTTRTVKLVSGKYKQAIASQIEPPANEYTIRLVIQQVKNSKTDEARDISAIDELSGTKSFIRNVIDPETIEELGKQREHLVLKPQFIREIQAGVIGCADNLNLLSLSTHGQEQSASSSSDQWWQTSSSWTSHYGSTDSTPKRRRAGNFQ